MANEAKLTKVKFSFDELMRKSPQEPMELLNALRLDGWRGSYMPEEVGFNSSPFTRWIKANIDPKPDWVGYDRGDEHFVIGYLSPFSSLRVKAPAHVAQCMAWWIDREDAVKGLVR